jgi:phenylpropionate dioxygenase-like ring-hydroxylating dioxygenase large terminal subunit
MQSQLSAEHYTCEAVFGREQKRVFRHLWIYACMRSAVAVDRAFVTRHIGGLPVLIQNEGGEIRAFENACPHRLMPIQTEAFGQRRMTCPYHGWSFESDGKVKSIPMEQSLFLYDSAERAALCLKRFAVESIGNLIFVNLSENPIPIEQQFAPALIAQLKDISGHFGSLSVHANIPTKYNWKLNFENVLDTHHVPFVHPKSFQPLLRGSIGKEDKPATTAPTLDSLADQSFSSSSPMDIQPWPWHDMVNRYGPPDHYHNFYLFPNVNFISVGGLVFLVQQFSPVSAGSTQVRFDLCLAQEHQRIAVPAILQGHLKGEIDVLMEDVVLMEALQAGLHNGGARVQHGKYETRLMSFARTYLQLMEEGS